MVTDAELADARTHAISILKRNGVPHHDAEDLVGHAILQLLNGRYVEERGKLLGWLVRVALNRRLDEARRAGAFDRACPDLVAPPSDPLGAAEVRAEAVRLLAPLLPRQRALLRLKAAGYTKGELAVAMGQEPTAICSRINRARAAARKAA